MPSATILMLIIIRPNQHISMISEVSWDSKYWSNDAENSALPLEE